ncbi:MAG: CDP-diacylglycerol--serine O-phosphatidyltransferase [Vicinamibacterales bacterium]
MNRQRLTLLGEPASDRRVRLLGPLGGPLRKPRREPRLRRGVYLLPSVFTLANMFCGYLCVVQAMRGEYASAAPFIGLALVLDALDGRIARLTKTETPFGLQFDSLADVISFGVAPAILAFSWGLQPLGRIGFAAGFIFVTGAAMRLARFNLQGSADKRYFVGMPSPAAAAVPAVTVFAFPAGPGDLVTAAAALAVVLVPAFLMVSTLRYYSFKTIDLQAPRSQQVVILIALVLVAVATHPKPVLVIVAYTYLFSGIVAYAWGRLKRRRVRKVEAEA